MDARVGRREGPGDPKERLQPLCLPFPSCLNGDKINPFPGHPGGRLCSQKNTRQLWVAEGEPSKDKHHQAAELLCLEELSGHPSLLALRRPPDPGGGWGALALLRRRLWQKHPLPRQGGKGFRNP